MQQPFVWINYIFYRCGYWNCFRNKKGEIKMGYWKKRQAELDEVGESTDGIDIEKEMRDVELTNKYIKEEWFDKHVKALGVDKDLAEKVKNKLKVSL